MPVPAATVVMDLDTKSATEQTERAVAHEEPQGNPPTAEAAEVDAALSEQPADSKEEQQHEEPATAPAKSANDMPAKRSRAKVAFFSPEERHDGEKLVIKQVRCRRTADQLCCYRCSVVVRQVHFSHKTALFLGVPHDRHMLCVSNPLMWAMLAQGKGSKLSDIPNGKRHFGPNDMSTWAQCIVLSTRCGLFLASVPPIRQDFAAVPLFVGKDESWCMLMQWHSTSARSPAGMSCWRLSTCCCTGARARCVANARPFLHFCRWRCCLRACSFSLHAAFMCSQRAFPGMRCDHAHQVSSQPHPLALLVQLHTRKRDIAEFSGWTYGEDQVRHVWEPWLSQQFLVPWSLTCCIMLVPRSAGGWHMFFFRRLCVWGLAGGGTQEGCREAGAVQSGAAQPVAGHAGLASQIWGGGHEGVPSLDTHTACLKLLLHSARSISDDKHRECISSWCLVSVQDRKIERLLDFLDKPEKVKTVDLAAKVGLCFAGHPLHCSNGVHQFG